LVTTVRPLLGDGDGHHAAAHGGDGGGCLDFKAGRRIGELFHAADRLAQQLRLCIVVREPDR
jgi:hypothetical protein